jgi:hypothetical protein
MLFYYEISFELNPIITCFCVLPLGFGELKQCDHEFLINIVIHYSSIHFVILSLLKHF